MEGEATNSVFAWLVRGSGYPRVPCVGKTITTPTNNISAEVQMVPKKCMYCINIARYPRVPCVAKQLLRGRWRNNNTPMKYKCPNAQILEYRNTKGSNTKYPNNQILHTLYPRVLENN